MELLLVGVVAFTSLAAYGLAVKGLGLSTVGLRSAVGRMLECVGIALIFAIVNFGVAAAVIFGVRALSSGFISLYWLDDVAWWALSVLQGLTWSLWREMGSGS
jgi:hypothetical protein